MTVQLVLPEQIEHRLRADVAAGRHASIEEAILARLSRSEDPDVLVAAGMNPSEIRRDLDDAWTNREDAVDGEDIFARIGKQRKSPETRSK